MNMGPAARCISFRLKAVEKMPAREQSFTDSTVIIIRD
eukprot:CAMPEP_0115890606 /NCGR_PEP_ID=MMETSP0287-20121206/33437_1 /TAXON_ID=412157 /ORGANISM="Chrysochromulina rotalis, Strain UIO044" /LENGTH=37 /DNA_ID= /DNA_START= /DNA_END= /DNA_ORIENTATION=